MRILRGETAAILVDMQEKLLPVMDRRQECEERCVIMMKGLRKLGIPFLITQQYTKGLGSTVPSLREAAQTEAFYDKRTFSCCKEQSIMEAIRKMGRRNILLLGIETHICVLQTCIDLRAEGYQPVLVADALSSRREEDKARGLQRGMQEGALVTTSEAVLFELTQDSRDPAFREISELIK